MVKKWLQSLVYLILALGSLWALYYTYIILPGYILAPLKCLRAQYYYLDVALKLDYGRCLRRIIRLIYVILLYVSLINYAFVKKRLKEFLILPKSKTVLWFALLVPSFFVALEYVLALKLNWITNVQVQFVDIYKLIFYAIVMLCTAMAEELAFRGITIAMLEGLIGANAAVWIQALFFGYGHWYCSGEVIYGILTVIAGLLFGYMVVQTRSIWPSVIMHWLWNFCQIILYGGTLVSFVVVNHSWLGSRVTPDEEGLLSGVMISLIFLIWLAFRPKSTKL